MKAEQTRSVPLLDLRAQFATLQPDVMDAIERVVTAQKLILGTEVEALEVEIAAYSQARFAVGCASGSDALLLALMALDVGPGDEVLTVPYTFFATAGAIYHARARPVFVDVDEDTFNINVELAAETLRGRPQIKAIIPVHLFGGCADMDPLAAVAREHGISVIEDAAQSIGSEYNGRRAGSLGDIACFSFFPSKNLGAFGDAGMCTTNDSRLAERLKSLRVHGTTRKYYHEWVGINSRLDALQAAILGVKLRRLDSWTAGRQRNAEIYRQLLSDSPVTLPRPALYQTRHIYNQFVIRCERRDELRSFLSEAGIGTEIYYPLPLHLQPCFSHLDYKRGDFPVSEALAASTLALPVYPELPSEDLEYVVEAIRAFYGFMG